VRSGTEDGHIVTPVPNGRVTIAFARRAVGALVAASLAAAGASCGGEDDAVASGAEIFSDAGCAGCHTLEAAGASGQVGPNLDDARPTASEVERRVRLGGGGMPSFDSRLSDAEIAAVAAYVAEAAGS
jgi:mono/diheme cytochrome c family protein